jgi:hypothetical protein
MPGWFSVVVIEVITLEAPTTAIAVPVASLYAELPLYDGSLDAVPEYTTDGTRSAHRNLAPEPLDAPGVSWITIDSPDTRSLSSGRQLFVAVPPHVVLPDAAHIPSQPTSGQFSDIASTTPRSPGSW